MRTIAAAFVLSLSALASAPATAAPSYDACDGFIEALPAVIGTQGTWCLDANLATALTSGIAIEVVTNNVTIDCTGHKIGGLSAGPLTETVGVQAVERINVTVTGCNLRGFKSAILLSGAGHLVERNRIEASTFRGIGMDAEQGIIRDNFVFNTGIFGTVATRTAILTGGDVDIVGNTIDGVDGDDIAGHVTGIFADATFASRITGNTVRNVQNGAALGTTVGIAVGTESWYAVVRDNMLFAATPLGAVAPAGIACGATHVMARDNQIMGYVATVEGCNEIGNDLVP